MLSYIIRRFFAGLVTIWAASILSFMIIQLPPGDYVTSYIAQLQSTGTVVARARPKRCATSTGWISRSMCSMPSGWA